MHLSYMQKTAFIVILSLICLNVCAQSKRANVWNMPEGIQIDFNCNPPCPSLNNTVQECGSSSSICDINGHLQFYTDNETIWSSNHEIMFNGTGLYSCSFSIQGSVIVPVTSNPYQYYLITCDNVRFPLNVNTPDYICSDINPVKNVLCLHLIDMRFNNGQGAVLWKNKIIYNGHVEQMLAAVKHANTKDTWLLTYDTDINRFVSLLLTDCGIEKTIISEDLGFRIISGLSPIRFSPKGDMFHVKADLPQPGNMVAHFNTTTGEASNSFFFRGYSLKGCFSADSRYLYSDASNSYEIPRYDLSLIDTATIYENKQTVKVGLYEGFNNGLQNGPNGKLYFTFDQRFVTWYIVDEPSALSFTTKSLYIPIKNQNLTHSTNPPNFVQSWFDPDFKEYEYGSPSFSFDRVCMGNKTTLRAVHIPPATNYHWEIYENGMPVTVYYNEDTITHTFAEPGTHSVRLVIDFSCIPDVIIRDDIIVDKLPVKYLQDTTVCEGSAVVAEAQPSQVSYVWNTGNTSNLQTAIPDQSYTVTVSNACGSKVDSITITKVEYKVTNLVTQNNDGMNEVLNIQTNSTTSGTLSIYNNWGSQVYANDVYQNTWPETTVEAGIYYYRFNISSCKPSNGWVQVIH